MGLDRWRIGAAEWRKIRSTGCGGWIASQRHHHGDRGWAWRLVGINLRGRRRISRRALGPFCARAPTSQRSCRVCADFAGQFAQGEWGPIGLSEPKHTGVLWRARAGTFARRQGAPRQPDTNDLCGPQGQLVDWHQRRAGALRRRKNRTAAGDRSAGFSVGAGADGRQRRKYMGGNRDRRAAHSARSAFPHRWRTGRAFFRRNDHSC